METISYPKTVSEAVEKLMSELSQENLDKIKNSRNLNEFHHGLGMYIRNQYGLWGKNPELLADCLKGIEKPTDPSKLEYYHYQHPDEASSIIIHALWEKLNEKV